MTAYINMLGNKVEWLEQEGKETTRDVILRTKYPVTDGFVPVVLVDNIAFHAAAVPSDKRDLEEFASLKDPRFRRYFFVAAEKLSPRVGIMDGYLKEILA
jgi:hypothetical protein